MWSLTWRLGPYVMGSTSSSELLGKIVNNFTCAGRPDSARLVEQCGQASNSLLVTRAGC